MEAEADSGKRRSPTAERYGSVQLEETSVAESKRVKADSRRHENDGKRTGTFRVYVIVGGKTFVTTRAVLEGSSYFEALLSGRWPVEDDSSQADAVVEFELDREPDPFAHVLAFLRSGRLSVVRRLRPFFCLLSRHQTHTHHVREHLAAVLLEADFYGVHALLAQVI